MSKLMHIIMTAPDMDCNVFMDAIVNVYDGVLVVCA